MAVLLFTVRLWHTLQPELPSVPLFMCAVCLPVPMVGEAVASPPWQERQFVVSAVDQLANRWKKAVLPTGLAFEWHHTFEQRPSVHFLLLLTGSDCAVMVVHGLYLAVLVRPNAVLMPVKRKAVPPAP